MDDLAGFEKSVLGSVYRELVLVLLTKAKLPLNPKSLSREDAETFRCYRQDIGDTMVRFELNPVPTINGVFRWYGFTWEAKPKCQVSRLIPILKGYLHNQIQYED